MADAADTQRKNCIFCQIAAKEQDTRLIYENEEIAVFPDIRPAAKYHYLVIPKEHYGNPKSLHTADHLHLVERLVEAGKKALFDTEADVNDALFGFHWPPFNSIDHLHLHVISPRSQMKFFARQIHRPNSFWFVTDTWLLQHLKKLVPENDSKERR